MGDFGEDLFDVFNERNSTASQLAANQDPVLRAAKVGDASEYADSNTNLSSIASDQSVCDKDCYENTQHKPVGKDEDSDDGRNDDSLNRVGKDERGTQGSASSLNGHTKSSSKARKRSAESCKPLAHHAVGKNDHTLGKKCNTDGSNLDDRDSERLITRDADAEDSREAIDDEVDAMLANVLKRPKITAADDLTLAEALPRIQIHRVQTIEACLHEVAIPPGMEFQPLQVPTGPPKKEFPFNLDPFQKQAILCLENTQSVLVSAHTSAGKTVVAVYAIAVSLQAKQRVIYTTPLKALSNQKYRELFDEFGDVGLMTGDVTINPTASCLVMTTEILRCMLYRGSELMREVAWVVFDEIHYMRDKDRGVVWEESIILLPDNVHYVFLSATIPNARQFAEWVCHLHKQPCHVVYTDYRPTPLQHYVYPSGAEGLYLVVDENGEFSESNFNEAMNMLQDGGGSSDFNRRSRGGLPGRGGGGDSNVFKLIKLIMERNFSPVIVFSFSRRDCEAYALEAKKLDLNSEEERVLVEEVFRNATDTLSDEDKRLPQVENVLPLLKRGIGIHHSGLLPLLKEAIEILFSEGLIKALFATETFSMGLNMPAKTVLFSSCRKFDGKEYRWITSGEYIQMSGRAGRRGLDDRGIVIMLVDERISPSVGKQILKGQPDPLNSAFRLTYNMVLNLIRVEEINPEYMLERSFYQFQNYAGIPALIDRSKALEMEYIALQVPDEQQIAAYYRIQQQINNLNQQLHEYIVRPEYLLTFLQPGRVVHVRHEDDDFSWAVVVNFFRKPDKTNPDGSAVYIVECLLNLRKDTASQQSVKKIKPAWPPGDLGEMVVVPLLMPLIQKVSAIRLYMPNDLRPLEKRQSVGRALLEVIKRFAKAGNAIEARTATNAGAKSAKLSSPAKHIASKEGSDQKFESDSCFGAFKNAMLLNAQLPLLDPIEDMKIRGDDVKDICKKLAAFSERLRRHPLANDSRLAQLYDEFARKDALAEQIRQTKQQLKAKRSLLQIEELKCMKRVLRRLGFVDSSDVIERKGRLACEISSVDELLITELLFNGVFNELTPEETCAILSCFLFQEKSKEAPRLGQKMSGLLRTMQETARRIARVSVEAKLRVDEEEYVGKIRPDLMDIVHAWASGSSFASICKMTDVFEGSVIRCMRRLEETLREMRQAAVSIGNTDLEQKFSVASEKIKRDIVFAASLYL